jgi:FkbM family methyltransferase
MSYSQNKEEEAILRFFKDTKGTFLDIGANDGETLSNTRQLALNGWSGVCVEPSPKAFDKLHELYKKSPVQCIQVAISDFCGVTEFHESGEHLGKGDCALLSTIVKSELKRWNGTESFTLSSTSVVDFEGLLARSAYSRFDFISIDAEGVDLKILKQIDFDKLKTKMVCVEWNSKQKQSYLDVMTPYGFRLYHENFENLIFVR